MCKCINVAFGSYDNQSLICNIPDHMIKYRSTMNGNKTQISIDTCLVEEIIYLWTCRITTTGCCCGHNHGEQYPYIGVEDEDIPKMKAMGYKVRFNPMYPEREDSFIPKTQL